MARIKNGPTGDIHSGRPTEGQRTVNPPTESGSTILFRDCTSFLNRTEKLYYGRTGTNTHRAFEENLARLEGAESVTLAPSGLASVTTALLTYARSGGHLLVTDNAYDPTRIFCDGFLKKMGVETTYYDPLIGERITELIRPNTNAIWCESPGSLTFEIQDLPAIVNAAANIPVIIDNTWSAGVFHKPLALGATLSIQAITKYIGGHSDLLMGAVMAKDAKAANQVAMTAKILGQSVSSQDVTLAHRGLRTLHRRMDVHNTNGQEVAQWLQSRPEVVTVLHPGLNSHPQHDIWLRDFTGACGLFGAILEWSDPQKTIAFCDALDLFGLGYSWGGFESLCIPATPTRTAIPWTEPRQLVRFHIGLENTTDLITNLADAFQQASAV